LKYIYTHEVYKLFMCPRASSLLIFAWMLLYADTMLRQRAYEKLDKRAALCVREGRELLFLGLLRGDLLSDNDLLVSLRCLDSSARGGRRLLNRRTEQHRPLSRDVKFDTGGNTLSDEHTHLGDRRLRLRVLLDGRLRRGDRRSLLVRFRGLALALCVEVL